MKIKFRKVFRGSDQPFIVDWLAQEIDLSKVKIKQTISLGGLWIKSGPKRKRVKKIKTQLQNSEFVEFFYDSNLVLPEMDHVQEIYKGHGFGVWYKPAGIVSDSTPYSDQGCLTKFISDRYKNAHLIQRLDREVSGLMLVCYNKKLTSFFSEQLKVKQIIKKYQVEVLGHCENSGVIEITLDDKETYTEFKRVKVLEDTSLCEVEIKTGRFHQIRRHFDLIGHPVMGDPRYGENNKNKTGLKLVAHYCGFIHPRSKKYHEISLNKELCLF